MPSNPLRRVARAALVLVLMSGTALLLASCDIDMSNIAPPCTHNWIGSPGGDFGTASNWDTNTVPGSADKACADEGTSVVVTTPQSVQSFDFKGTLTIPSGSSLDVVSSQYLSGVGNLQLHGTLSGDGSMLVGGLTLTGTLQGSGFVMLLGSQPNSFADGRIGGTRVLYPGTLTDFHGGFQLCDDAAVRVNGILTVDDVTTIDSTFCPSTVNPRIEITSEGTLNVDANLITSVPVSNDGAVVVGAAQFTAASFDQSNGSTSLTSAAGSLVPGGGYGPVVINGGTLTGTGTVTGYVSGSGTFVPGTGASGTLTVNGEFAPTGTVQFQLGGTNPGVDMATMQVSGAVNVTGASLVATFSYGYTPVGTPSFTLISSPYPVGPFAAETLPAPYPVLFRANGIKFGQLGCNTTLYHPGANLAGANLAGVDMNHCNLTGASFAGADLTNADLTGATLSSANLTNATISGATLHDAVGINTVTGLLSTLGGGWSYTDFSGTGLDLHGQNVTQGGTFISFDHVNLAGANLAGANLSIGQFTGGNLSGANLSGADLSSANLVLVSLASANLAGANVQGASIDVADITNTVLTGTDLSFASGVPNNPTLGLFSNTTCPSEVNSDANSGNCEGEWHTGA
jgi:uncharacterized protein YjbI with pentapeptide repeats